MAIPFCLTVTHEFLRRGASSSRGDDESRYLGRWNVRLPVAANPRRKFVSYPEAVDALVRSAAASGVEISLKPPQGESTTFCEQVFGRPLAAAIAAHGYPHDAELPWIVEDLYLYGPDELSDRQAGYRSDAGEGRPSAGWDATQFVVADWAANPVTIGQDGVIHYARHGTGAWMYTRIVSDLPAFFLLLAAWLDYMRDKADALYDDNFEIPDAIRADIRSKVVSMVDEADQDAACRFLLGEF